MYELFSFFHLATGRYLTQMVNLYHSRSLGSTLESGIRSRLIFHEIADKVILSKFILLAVIDIHSEILAGFLREVFQSDSFIPSEVAYFP